ncbi:MAG: carbamoyltransferase C-terminal domain-containing protein [Planctomycetota bacterium]
MPANNVFLGITDGDDAGAALVVDGKLVAAVNEERLNRMKMSIGFPRLAVAEVLRLGDVQPADVTQVAMASFLEVCVPESEPNKGWFHDASGVGTIRNAIASTLAKPLGNWAFARSVYRALKRLSMGRRRSHVSRLLGQAGITAPVAYFDHHRCHAIASFAASGFEDAVSISLDGGGDGSSGHVYRMNGLTEELLHNVDSFDSIGNYYAYVTHLCGYRASIHEGKITGLSARGKPLHLDLLRELIDFEDGSIVNKGRVFFGSAIRTLRERLPQDWEHEDLAASIQTHLEEVVTKYMRHWIPKSGRRNVCLSGGVFANVLMNQRISDLEETDNVYVYPAMGDGGLASGAAICASRDAGHAVEPVSHVYLGSSFSDEEIESALKDSGLPYERHDPIENKMAELLKDGRVVARFNGAMEYGPRALGNRTIMYRTSERAVNDWLNKRLNRTEFMPFAPAVLAGEEDKLFMWNDGSASPARYMTITMECTEWMRERCPAVVHIDGTARPQVVEERTNPSFHKVLTNFHELTGVPVLVNTSFNMHEEPIVCTPGDAIRAFRLGRLDHLAIGPFLLTHEDGLTNKDAQ